LKKEKGDQMSHAEPGNQERKEVSLQGRERPLAVHEKKKKKGTRNPSKAELGEKEQTRLVGPREKKKEEEFAEAKHRGEREGGGGGLKDSLTQQREFTTPSHGAKTGKKRKGSANLRPKKTVRDPHPKRRKGHQKKEFGKGEGGKREKLTAQREKS